MSRLRRAMARAVAALLIVCLALPLLAACSGPDRSSNDGTPTATAPTTGAPATSTLTQPAPTAPVEIATSTASAATADTPTPTATGTSPVPTATLAQPPTETPAPTATPDPEPTLPAAPASQRVDLPDVDAHYRLTISELRLSDGYVRASETITIRDFREVVPERLYLQVVPAAFGFFTLHSLTLDGEPAQPESLNDGFTLALSLPPEAAAPLEIGVEFSLSVGVDPSGWAPVMLDGGILRLGTWFPMLSNDHGYSDIFDPSYTASADFDVSVTLDAGLDVAHAAEVIAERVEPDGRVTLDLRASRARDFALVFSGGFVVDEAVTASGVRVALHTSAASADTRQAILGWAVEALEQMEALVGPYPYASFVVVDAGPSMPGGLEFPGLIYINLAYERMQSLIYHEVAHQWLYSVIGTRALDDGWIDEGGAEFFERALPSGFSDVPQPPASDYLYWLDSTADELRGAAWLDAYYAIYEQGARLFYAVLDAMGWDAFWAAMQSLYAEFAFGVATAWDVLANWQAHSATDLRPLFREFFRYEWIDLLPEPGT